MNTTDELQAAAIVGTPEGLSAIHRPDCASVIWRREPLARFQDWIDALEPEFLPKARLVLRPRAIHDAAIQVCDIAGCPESPERTRLIDDVAALGEIFADLVSTSYLRMRLEIVRSNACRKFHIDAVTARLVCTYRGSGTQYGLAKNGADPERVFSTPTGSPIILRGTKWPAASPTPLRHRSPPIEGTGETRLLLVFDPVSDPDEE